MADFSTLIKPASSLCNMRCKYCFYADETSLRSTPCYGVMSKETSEKIIDRAYEFTQNGGVGFAFQGGEPTVAGLDYFTHFVDYAKRKRPENVKLNFSIQTNGLLIDENWCKLLAENDFLVGLSMDGPRDINDFSRIDASGEGTFDRVLKTAKLFKKHKVEFNILTVLTKQAAKHPTQLWNFYQRNGFDFAQIIPCLAPLDLVCYKPCELVSYRCKSVGTRLSDGKLEVAVSATAKLALYLVELLAGEGSVYGHKVGNAGLVGRISYLSLRIRYSLFELSHYVVLGIKDIHDGVLIGIRL